MCYGLSTLLRAHRLPHLGPILKVGMTSFVNPHKVVARKNAFSALPSAQNGGELEGEVSKEEEKHFFF